MTNKESPYIANHNEKVTARVRHLPRAHTTTWRDELASAIGEAKGEARQEQCGHALSSELESGPIGTPGRSASVPEFGRRSRLSLGRGKRLARAERLGVGMPMALLFCRAAHLARTVWTVCGSRTWRAIYRVFLVTV
jgi:hypothetical protein